ncbi:negative cofactor 2 transcription regulator complex subunit ncb2, partial [Tulasnella sp. 403]
MKQQEATLKRKILVILEGRPMNGTSCTVNAGGGQWLRIQSAGYKLRLTPRAPCGEYAQNNFNERRDAIALARIFEMSDREGPSGSGAPDDDLSLPKATVYKLITGVFEQSLDDLDDLVDDHHVPLNDAEFIHLISSEANEICEKESKKTISPEHVVGALKVLGFEGYVEEVEEVLKDHKQQQKDREKKVSKFEQSGLTEEELLQRQEALFAEARARAAGAAATT